MREFETTIKLDNAQAHLESILSNIVVANESLTEVFETRKSAQHETVIAEKELKNTLALLKGTQGSLIQKRQELIDTVKELESTENTKKTKILLLEKEYSEKFSAYGEQVERNTKFLKDIFAEIAQSKLSLSKLLKEVATTEQTLETLSMQRRSLKNDVEEISRTTTEKRLSNTKELSQLQEELLILKNIVAAEKNKVGNAEINIQQKVKELDRREKDILIVTKRLKNLFNEINPGVSLKI